MNQRKGERRKREKERVGNGARMGGTSGVKQRY